MFPPYRSGKYFFSLSHSSSVSSYRLTICFIFFTSRCFFDVCFLFPFGSRIFFPSLCISKHYLEKKPENFDTLLQLLQEAGWEIKQGKQISLKLAEHKRFMCLDSLGDNYTEEKLQAVLAGEKTHTPKRQKVQTAIKHEKISQLVDIQAKLQEGKGAGYERWAKVFNLKQMAQTANYLTEHGLLEYETLTKKVNEMVAQHAELFAKIKGAEKHMSEIAELKKQIINYSKTRDVYEAYQKSGYSKKFLAAHGQDIQIHKAAKKAFDELGMTKLPTVKSLQAEYEALLTEKQAAYGGYRRVKDEMRELLTIKTNVDKLLKQTQENEQVNTRESDQEHS